MVVRDLLTRGLLAGLLAGALALGVAEVLGEPQVSRAIAVETQRAKQEGKAPRPRPRQPRRAEHRWAWRRGCSPSAPRSAGSSGWRLPSPTAGSAVRRGPPRLLVSPSWIRRLLPGPVPQVPGQPAVGRSALRPSDIAPSCTSGCWSSRCRSSYHCGGFVLGRRLTGRFGAWNAALLAAAVFLVLWPRCSWPMPGIDEIPDGFPPTTLWRFRVASLATQLILWAAMGLIFGPLTERHRARPSRQHFDAVR